MSMTPIPRRSPRGPPPLWLKIFKSQRVYLETPWVSTGIWWVSVSCVCYAMGFLRVSSKPPWVSTGICAFGLTFLWFCCRFPQVCLHSVLTSIWRCYRFACDLPMDLLCRPLCVASRNGRRQCGWVCGFSCGRPAGFYWVSCKFSAGFQWDASRFPPGFLWVSGRFPANSLNGCPLSFLMGFL